ncbi:Rhodanese-like domain-containing protein [Cladochytrium replicatum]|nr:Rhodanese-like domain-containing protein [Cladochytrium replicatum]
MPFKLASKSAALARSAFAAARSTHVLARGFQASRLAASRYTDLIAALKSSVSETKPADLWERLTADPLHGPPAGLHVIDVRETYEWNEEFIPYAKYISKGTLERDIETLVSNPNDEIVVYCAGGARSIIAAESLQRMGYAKVTSLEGGIGGWKKAGLGTFVNTKPYSERLDHTEV